MVVKNWIIPRESIEYDIFVNFDYEGKAMKKFGFSPISSQLIKTLVLTRRLVIDESFVNF